MNEEVSRIITLLEQGKISASEAEKLIKALNEIPSAASEARREPEEETGSEARCCPNPFRDFQLIAQRISEAGARAARRHARFARWRYDEYRSAESQARAARAESMSPLERVQFVLRERVMVEKTQISPEDSIEELLDPLRRPFVHIAQIPSDNLRRGLEDEFGISITPEVAAAWKTVQDIVNHVSPEPKKKRAA